MDVEKKPSLELNCGKISSKMSYFGRDKVLMDNSKIKMIYVTPTLCILPRLAHAYKQLIIHSKSSYNLKFFEQILIKELFYILKNVFPMMVGTFFVRQFVH